MDFTQTHSTAAVIMQFDPDITVSDGPAIVFGHADADGHLATEQTRQYLTERGLNVTTIVSTLTRNYRFWSKLSDFDLGEHGLVVFVDIAFSFRDPNDSLTQLLKVSDQHTHKRFVVIDHHPLIHPSIPRKNVSLIEVADPYDCCLGNPDPDIMRIAALCDGAPTRVTPSQLLRKRAIGVKRAAADVNGIAGKKLLDLIKERQWEFFEALADESSDMHRSVRGIRHTSNSLSPLLEYANDFAPSAQTK